MSLGSVECVRVSVKSSHLTRLERRRDTARCCTWSGRRGVVRLRGSRLSVGATCAMGALGAATPRCHMVVALRALVPIAGPVDWPCYACDERAGRVETLVQFR